MNPYVLILAAGVADVATSIIGWSYGLKEVYVLGGSFLWVFYWLILVFAVLHVETVPGKVKLWFPIVSGTMLFTIPILNVVTLFNTV